MQWRCSYILISHPSFFRASYNKMPSDLLPCGSLRGQARGPASLSGSQQTKTCIQYFPPVLSLIHVQPLGQRENKIWEECVSNPPFLACVLLMETQPLWLRSKTCRCRSLKVSLRPHLHRIIARQIPGLKSRKEAWTWSWTVNLLFMILGYYFDSKSHHKESSIWEQFRNAIL